VSDNTWDERTISYGNNPTGSTVLATWSHGDDLHIDVTDVLQDALVLDAKLSIRIVSTLNNGSIPKYGSRENTNPVARPQLAIHYVPLLCQESYAAWAVDQNLVAGVQDGYEDDPDLDQMKNLLEYALGADPLVDDAASFGPRLDVWQNNGIHDLNYVYRRRIDHQTCGLAYAVEAADDLRAPIWGTNGISEAGVGMLDAEFQAVTNSVSTEVEASRFLQLKVTAE
jgi:hypothetical protein